MVNARFGRSRKLKQRENGAVVSAGAKPKAAKGAPFELQVSAEVGKGYSAMLRKLLPAARREVKAALVEFHVILVGNDAMAKLHWDFMQIEGPTDVMTFPIDLDDTGQPISGEVYICVPYAQREAKERGVNPANEVLLYAIHGMLHLSGYDDRTGREFAKMHAKEDSILQAIGVGAVFRAPSRDEPSLGKTKARGITVKQSKPGKLTRSVVRPRLSPAIKTTKRVKTWQ